MANPQPDQYTRISNELFDAIIKKGIPTREARQVFDFILRKTYGYHKKSDRIATSQIMAATNLPRRSVERARANLRKWRLITTVKTDGSQGLILSVNKNYDTWQLPSKTVRATVRPDGELPSDTQEKLPSDTRYTKDIKIIKDNIQKKEPVEVVSRFEQIWKRYPNKDGRKEAERHFKASVKTPQDWQDINTALDNYLKDEKVLRGYIKMGSTWFNNWRDWIAGPLTPLKRTAAQVHNVSSLVKFREEHKDDNPIVSTRICSSGDSVPGI